MRTDTRTQYNQLKHLVAATLTRHRLEHLQAHRVTHSAAKPQKANATKKIGRKNRDKQEDWRTTERQKHSRGDAESITINFRIILRVDNIFRRRRMGEYETCQKLAERRLMRPPHKRPLTGEWYQCKVAAELSSKGIKRNKLPWKRTYSQPGAECHLLWWMQRWRNERE